MGQGESKPPIRQVIPFAEEDYKPEQEEEEEETGESNIDMLGVSPEESDYPEPKPPDKNMKGGKTQTLSKTEAKSDKTNVSNGYVGEIFSTKSTLGEGYQVDLVPVGASFQNAIKKKADTSAEDESVPSNNGTPWSSYPVVKSVARSLSLRDSLLGSNHLNSDVSSGVSKREVMLAEREKYEYKKLIAPSTETVTHKGQVRKFNYDTHSTNTDKFRNVEDRLADEIAEKHKDHRAETYQSLMTDLIADIHSDRLKVKVILAWMSKQHIGRLQFQPKPPLPDTPNGYMLLMQEGQGTFPVFFALLCRAAKLKCAIIHGISKGSHYEVGSKDTENLKNTWNAVYVEGSWKLVHPLWVCKGVANRQLGGWMKIEEEGKAQRKLSEAITGKDIPSFNPYFIFTKPEEFIYRNFPDEERWQLLPNPLTLDEFLNMTYIRPLFFLNNFKLESEDCCIHESESGEPCEIKISFPKEKTFDAVFGYELSMKVEEETTDEKSIISLSDEASRDTVDIVKETERFVLVKKCESLVTFEVRFFFRGTYKLRLYGGYFKEFGNKPPWIMDVLLMCDNVIPQVVPLPFDPGPVGWGPGPVSENLGLYVPSHVESEVLVNDEEDTIIYFILQQKLNIRVELHHCTIESNDLEEFIETGIIQIGDIMTLQIRVIYPGSGEYGLKIDVISQQREDNACNYIIHTSEKRPFEPFYPRRARRMLLNAMETCDLDLIKIALDESERVGLQGNDPDVIGTRNRYEFLSCKTELYVALLVNRIDVAEHALHRTRKAKLDILLGKEMAKVEEHLEKLLKLDEGGWNCDVPDIDRQSLVELSQLRKPKLEVRLAITAMYMLLGVDEEHLKDWAKVQKFLRNQQSTLIEVARLEKYLTLGTTSDVTVAESVLDRVQEILKDYTAEDIRRVDNTAVAYFQWVVSVTEKLKENHRKIEQARSAKANATKSISSLSRKSVSQSGTQLPRSQSLASNVLSLNSKSRTPFGRTSTKGKIGDDDISGGKSQRSSRLMSVNRSTGLKTISEEPQTLPANKSHDQFITKTMERKSSTVTVMSKTGKSNVPSAKQSVHRDDNNSGKASANPSLVSLSKRSVSSRRTSVQTVSGNKSHLSEVVSNGHIAGNKTTKENSLLSSGQEQQDKNSETFVRASVNKSRHTLNPTPVSRKASDATHISVKSLSKSTKSKNDKVDNIKPRSKNDALENVKQKHIEAHYGDGRVYSFRNEGITGKTFFSDSGRSQKSSNSRPVSKMSNKNKKR